jgi:hypothetical protein
MEPKLDSDPRADRAWHSRPWRWVASAACSLAALVLLAVVLGGTYVPRKNAARDLRASRQRIVALLAPAMPAERQQVEDGLDCVVRGVFRARLTVAEVASLRQVCMSALADGVITQEEAEGIGTAAHALCQQAGGPEKP